MARILVAHGNTQYLKKAVIDLQPGYVEGTYGLAVDIGSTTVAGYLCDLRTGELLATEAAMNPQVVYGEDLMSRVSYAMMNPGGAEEMTRAVRTAISELVLAVSAGLLGHAGSTPIGHATFGPQP